MRSVLLPDEITPEQGGAEEALIEAPGGLLHIVEHMDAKVIVPGSVLHSDGPANTVVDLHPGLARCGSQPGAHCHEQ